MLKSKQIQAKIISSKLALVRLAFNSALNLNSVSSMTECIRLFRVLFSVIWLGTRSARHYEKTYKQQMDLILKQLKSRHEKVKEHKLQKLPYRRSLTLLPRPTSQKLCYLKQLPLPHSTAVSLIFPHRGNYRPYHTAIFADCSPSDKT